MTSSSVSGWAIKFSEVPLAAVVLILWFGATANAAYTYSCAAIDHPAATETWPRGTNDSGQIVGAYADAAGWAHGLWHDGLRTAATLDNLGATRTSGARRPSGEDMTLTNTALISRLLAIGGRITTDPECSLIGGHNSWKEIPGGLP